MRSYLGGHRLLIVVAMMVGALALPVPITAQSAGCADYTTTAAAQFALDINPGLAAALDPDGNGVACDHDAGSQPDPSSTELQLPTEGSDPTPPATDQSPASVDVIDQQPTDTTTTTTQPQAGQLDARLGSSRAAFEATYGQPVDEVPSETDPRTTAAAYTSPASASELLAIHYDDQVAIVLLSAAQPWTSDQAVAAFGPFVPQDVTDLPQSEQLADGSLLITVVSPVLATGVTPEMMASAGLPGVPGDMYLLLTLDANTQIVEIELGIGNGDNVRADLNGGDGTEQPPVTTPTPVTSTGADATTFLQQARGEVDTYRSEISELRTILGKDAFTEADTARLSEIALGWIALGTTSQPTPAGQESLGGQLQSVHTDLSTVGDIVFTVVTTGDASRVQEAADALTRAETTLDTMDQQLTALGF